MDGWVGGGFLGWGGGGDGKPVLLPGCWVAPQAPQGEGGELALHKALELHPEHCIGITNDCIGWDHRYASKVLSFCSVYIALKPQCAGTTQAVQYFLLQAVICVLCISYYER